MILGVGNRDQDAPGVLPLLYVRGSRGGLVPLDTLVSTDTGVGPLTVSHSGQLPSVTVSFDLSPGVSLGQAVAAVDAASRFLDALQGVTDSSW